MPLLGICFLTGTAALCALPPLNGFMSEFILYIGSLGTLVDATGPAGVLAWVVIASLAFIGCVTVACFSRLYGIIFLGRPRSEYGQAPQTIGNGIKIPLTVLAASCAALGVGAPYLLPRLANVVSGCSGVAVQTVSLLLRDAAVPLAIAVRAALFAGCVLWLIAAVRGFLLRPRTRDYAPTWDCGYHHPTPRMQYTASSFAQPLVDFFKDILRTQKHQTPLHAYFPREASFQTESADVFQETVFSPLFKITHRLAGRFTWFQHGRLQLYVLYILLTLVALFLWRL
jgi:NADH:ubiquinone oxidoreductase subunit 5 (subunit L)/multisubunit Na+/H+ antiporter MnhA subunit